MTASPITKILIANRGEIASMGSKIKAKQLMQQADVPVLPTVKVADQSIDAIRAQLKDLQWPLLVKASAGGGGRGMLT